MDFDYIVVGAGLAGATFAERVATQANKSVCVIEQRPHIGGNCFDDFDENGILVQRYGIHCLHTNNKQVWDYLSQFTEWHYYQLRAEAVIHGRNVPIPFNLDSLRSLYPASLSERIESILVEKYGLGSRVTIKTLRESENEMLQSLGEFVYENLFLNYSIKQWGRNPAELDPSILARVPISISRDDRYFSDRYQAVPRHGFTAMIDRMLNHDRIRVIRNVRFQDIGEIKGSEVRLFGKHFPGTLVYTGAIDSFFDHRFGPLPYRSLNFDFQHVDGVESYQPRAMVNSPNDYDFTRVIEFKHITGQRASGTTILREYPETFEEERNVPCYPVLTEESRDRYWQYKAAAAELPNVVFIGRLGEYRYYNMDQVVEKCLAVSEDLLTRGPKPSRSNAA